MMLRRSADSAPRRAPAQRRNSIVAMGVLTSYAFAYEANDAHSRPRALCGAEASRRERRSHLHRRPRAHASSRAAGGVGTPPRARAPSLVRSRAVPGRPLRPGRDPEPGGDRAAGAGVVIALDTSILAY